MPRYKDESPAVRVYTLCDESRYLVVRNVPELGCGDDLLQLFSSYGEVEECKPMDAEDCEPFTDVYWIKFRLFSNARFAKRKLDDFVFLGNQLQVSYAPHFETLSDTKDKLEGRRREVLARLNCKLLECLPYKHRHCIYDLQMPVVGTVVVAFLLTYPCVPHDLISARRSKETASHSSSRPQNNSEAVAISSNTSLVPEHLDRNERDVESKGRSHGGNLPITTVSSNQDYFASHSMNQTVRHVRDKLDKIRSSGEHLQAGSASKKTRIDNRRRI